MAGAARGDLPVSISARVRASLRRKLLAWYQGNARSLPWRCSRDPYAILVAEFMLQQTRVGVVIPFFERFLERFPTFEALAQAPLEDVLRAWSGLGYYQRARNLHRLARRVAEQGSLPRTYSELKALPGVGDYTAAAVASIAFGEPHAAVDGNVRRVLARLTGCSPAASQNRKWLENLAEQLLDRRSPGTFNQALMDLGAVVCRPRAPTCQLCPWRRYCVSARTGFAPVGQAGRRRIPADAEQILIGIRRGRRVLMWRRPVESQRLAGFWELPESSALPDWQLVRWVGEFSHMITQTRYRVRVAEGKVWEVPAACQWVDIEELAWLPVSTMSRKALRLLGWDGAGAAEGKRNGQVKAFSGPGVGIGPGRRTHKVTS